MGSVYKRKARGKQLPYYQIQYKDQNGRAVQRSTKVTDKRAALRILAELENSVALINAGLEDPHREEKLRLTQKPVEEAQREYMEHFGTRSKRRGRGTRAPTTVRDERNNLRLVLQDDLMVGVSRMVDFREIRPLVDVLSRRWLEAGLSGLTVNKRVASLIRFLAWARREGYLRANPMGEWQSFVHEPSQPKRELSDDEVDRLLQVGRERGRHLYYLLAVRTGLRRSEMRRLQVEDLDLEEGRLFLPWHKAKGRRDAAIPLASDLQQALMDHFQEQGPLHPTAPVFATTPASLTIRKDFSRAGIPHLDAEGKRASLHSLRMTLATQLADLNIPLEVKQELMRHADYRTTQQHYVRIPRERLTQAVSQMDRKRRTGS